jgi:hypothetical protein
MPASSIKRSSEAESNGIESNRFVRSSMIKRSRLQCAAALMSRPAGSP